MIAIDKKVFTEHFAPTKSEGKRKTEFENGSSITTKYKTDKKYVVKYLSGNYAEYYLPKFIFKMGPHPNVRVIPILNFNIFVLIPITLAILFFLRKVEMENIWTVVLFLILFVFFLQGILIVPSLWNIGKRVDEKNKN